MVYPFYRCRFKVNGARAGASHLASALAKISVTRYQAIAARTGHVVVESSLLVRCADAARKCLIISVPFPASFQ
jgi:hypothetical protein